MTTARPRRIVLDTQVVLDLLHFEDPRTQSLRTAIDAGMAQVVSDEACRAEFLRVLSYPALGMSPATRTGLEACFDALVAERIVPVPREVVVPPLPRCRDHDDQKFLELALAAGAHFLLTRDAELLRLAPRCAKQGRFLVLAPERFGLVG